MPGIQTKELIELIDARAYQRIVVKRVSRQWFLLVYDLDGTVLIHMNKNGFHKQYRHAYQPLDWLAQKFGLTEVDVEYG